MTSVDLDVAGWSGRGGDTGRLHAVVGSTLQLVNDAIKRVDDRMGRVRGVPGIGYVDRSWQIGEVARQLAVLDGYVRELPADIGGMDHELYARLAGSDCPAHNLSQIHVGDFTASNVGGVRAWGVDVDGAQRWVELDRLRFIDFTGADPGVEAVDGFSGIFHDMYQVWLGRPAHPEDVGLAGYVEGLVASGEFGHRGYHPVGDFITGLLDFTVVWPVVKAVAGHDPIVDEDLGEWERVLGVGMAVADLVALVLALPTGGGSLAGPGLLRAGLGSAARMLLVNALATGVSMLTYDVAIVLDLPPWVAALVAVGMGVAISVVGGKYVLQRLDKHGRPIGEATMVDIGPPKQTVLDDVARPGIKPVAENLAAHGIDPRGVNPREVTLAHITDDISHSPNFEKASTDWQTARTVDSVGDAARTADLIGDASKARAADTVSDLASPERHPHPANVADDAGAPRTGKSVDAEPHPSSPEPETESVAPDTIKPGYEPGGRWDDPQARIDWLNDLKGGPNTGPEDLRTRRTINTDQDWAKYQRKVAGPEEYKLKTSGADEIWADSVHIDSDGIAEVDAKFVDTTGKRSLYEGGRPDYLYQKLDDEFMRYGAVIRDADNPVVRLRIITNTPEAAEFLLERARSIIGTDIDIEVVVKP